MTGIYKTPSWQRYILPFLAVALTVAMRMLLLNILGGHPLVLFFIPVILVTWLAGALPGSLALALSIFSSSYFSKPHNLQVDTWDGFVRALLFALVSLFSIFVITQLHKARYRAETNQYLLEQEISDRKKIEEELRKEMAVRAKAEVALIQALENAEKANNAKTEFLANMSHEIRTPMNAVVGLSSILAMTTPLTTKQSKCITTLKLSADALMALIDDLLDITKIESQSIELENIAFNLRHITEDVMEIMALRAKEKSLDFVIESFNLKCADFVGDPTRIKQIMMNLCSNAIKFTDIGMVCVTLSSVSSTQNDENVSISVRDTGPGIPTDKIDKIFGKFIQGDSSINRKFGGSGLGLAITKSLTEVLGGKISVESSPGHGSVFTVILPLRRRLVDDARYPVDDTETSIADNFSSIEKKILLVEDNAANILVASSFLEDFGFAFDVVTDGAQALKKLEKQDYFAVLMDVRMPGLSGIETTLLFRQSEERLGRKRLPIIGMTAHAMAGDKERCLAAGMNDYMSKPFDPEELERKLKSYYTKQHEKALTQKNKTQELRTAEA